MNTKQFVLMLAGFVGPLSGNAVLALLPTLCNVFHVSATAILISIPIFMLPFATIQIFSGALSDINRKFALLFGLSSYSIGAIICAFSNNFEFFLAGRLVQGIGFAFVNPVITAILGDIVPTKSRGSAMGFLGASTTAGIALGPLVAGAVAIINWRFAFFIFASLGLVVIVLFSITFANLQFKGSFALKDVGKKLFETAKNRNVESLMLCGFLTFFSYIAAISFISAELSGLEFSDASIGVIISSAGIAGIISSPIAGRIADWLGRRSGAIIGYSI
ncbi:MAG: MFS transporter, partial [Thermoplasmata archaeon]